MRGPGICPSAKKNFQAYAVVTWSDYVGLEGWERTAMMTRRWIRLSGELVVDIRVIYLFIYGLLRLVVLLL